MVKVTLKYYTGIGRTYQNGISYTRRHRQSTKIFLLSEGDELLHLSPVLWGYTPGWKQQHRTGYSNNSDSMTGRSVG